MSILLAVDRPLFAVKLRSKNGSYNKQSIFYIEITPFRPIKTLYKAYLRTFLNFLGDKILKKRVWKHFFYQHISILWRL